MKVNIEQEAATRASCRVALEIAKRGKPFTDGEMIKDCVIAVVEEMYHEKSLCGKCLDVSEVLKPVISVVNFIRSTGLNHRQFREFIEEMEENDLPYYTAVLWLSCGKVLQRFFVLRAVIEFFLMESSALLPNYKIVTGCGVSILCRFDKTYERTEFESPKRKPASP
ncbi:unnamed protein product [Psylliodes chrysocephalus]|uniref:Uncharacterized protein n=1 Tax=Psylliodes chrysocephalus TaxID=3402493 RepID=A0A9P0CY25_9CUCU|nr:unnamed protein product [Psylliodes chrysocephala]